jgi:DNA-directed RNA polymerase specialized sigma24 family protein
MEQADDILNRSTLIFLQKIEDGSYQFQGHAPSTYLIEVARRVALSATRAQKKATAPLDGHNYLPDPETEAGKNRQEATELVRQLLERLGDPCAQVIRLHHIEGYSDEEVVQQKLTRYTTIDSLKMKRSDCMKKLIQLARQWKISNHI